MNRYAGAALMWGVALGAVLYRYAMLPFDWSSPWRHVLPGIAIGLAVAGQQMVRGSGDDDAKWPAVPKVLGLGIIGAALAFGLSYLAFPTLSRVGLERREFPGFSFELPKGTIIDNHSDYASGKVSLKDLGGQNGVAVIGWELGEVPGQHDLEMIGELLTKAIGDKVSSHSMTTVTGPDGKPVSTIVFRGDATLAMSGLQCGGRYVFLAIGGSDSALALHERVLKTFVCKPDAALEKTARITFPLVIDLPGWYLSENSPDQIQITDGHSALTLRTQDAGLKVDVGLIVEGMFKAAGVTAKITSRQGERVNVTLTADGEEMAGWVRLRGCPDATAFMLALGVNQASLDKMYNAVESARCLRKGEPPQQWPAAPGSDGADGADGAPEADGADGAPGAGANGAAPPAPATNP